VRLLRACTVATAVTAPVAWLDGSLFAWHPALMAVGAVGCATEAALAARSGRATEPGPARVAALWRHARWAAAALACLAGGAAAIVANKAVHGKRHLRSTHARVGAAAGAAAAAAGVLGPLAFRTLGFNTRLPPAWQDRVKVLHRLVSSFLVFLDGERVHVFVFCPPLSHALPPLCLPQQKKKKKQAGALTWGLCALAIELGLRHKAVYRVRGAGRMVLV
jgi:hypothetical protein